MGGFFGQAAFGGGTLIGGNVVARDGFFGPVFVPNALTAGIIFKPANDGGGHPVWGDIAAGGQGTYISGSFTIAAGTFSNVGLFLKITDNGTNFRMDIFCTVTPLGFTKALINGHTYLSAAATFIPGCGLNTFLWTPQSGMVIGNTYSFLLQ